jgi:hypothetical protein
MDGPSSRYIGTECERRAAAAIHAILEKYWEVLRTSGERLPAVLRRRREELIQALRILCEQTRPENLDMPDDAGSLRVRLSQIGITALREPDTPPSIQASCPCATR